MSKPVIICLCIAIIGCTQGEKINLRCKTFKISSKISKIIPQTGAPSHTQPKIHQPHERIIGGHELDITEAPWQVSLQNDGVFHFCGGSIIAPQWILTAAHCVSMHVIDPSILRVRVGSTYRYSDGELFQAEKVWQHPNYVAVSFDFDVALIRLKTQLTFNEKVQPAKLPTHDKILSSRTNGLVSGWGETQSPSESTKHLRGADVQIIDENCAIKRIMAKLHRI